MVDLYYLGDSILEFLVHEAAERSGAYREAGVDVALRDGSGGTWPDLEAEAPLSIGVAGAIQSRLSGRGVPWTVVSVNTQRPLFWMVAEPSIEAIGDLRGERVAGRPRYVPPGTFTYVILREHGVDPEEDCEYLPQDDNRAGVDLLRRGKVAASYTAAPPFDLEREGYRTLAYYGEEFPTTATGIAVNESRIDPNSEAVQAVVRAQRSALSRLHEDREFAVAVLRDIEPDLRRAGARRLYEEYVRPDWTTDGRPDRKIARRSLERLAEELGVETHPNVEDIYDVTPAE